MSNLRPFTSSAEPEEDAVTECIDLSGHNWEGMNRVVFADVTAPVIIVKATEGVGTAGRPDEDRTCALNCSGARGIGATLGLYHYLRIRHGRPQDARQQAREFAQVYKREHAEFAELDIEIMENEAATPAEAQEAARDFIGEWRDIINDPMLIYGSPGEHNHFGLSAVPELAVYPLSMAGYSLIPPTPQLPWHEWFLWQYTGSGNAPGVTGACDRYRYRGALRQFRAAMGLAAPLDPGHERAGD